jgi:CRP-like cAMP-binding protein
MDKLQVLKKSELFQDLTQEELEMVGKLATTQTFKSGSTITKQDTEADKLYVIEEGSAAIVLEVGPLTQRQVQSAGRFEVLGWGALIEPYVYTASSKAVETTMVVGFNAQDLDRLCRSQTDIGMKVFKGAARVVAKRLAAAYAQLLGVTVHH